MLYLYLLCQRDSGSGFVQLYFALCFLFMYPLNGYFDYSSHQTKDAYLLSFGDTESNVFLFFSLPLEALQPLYNEKRNSTGTGYHKHVQVKDTCTYFIFDTFSSIYEKG